MELPAEPCYLWMLVGRLRVGEVDATLLGVAPDTSPTEFVEQIGAAFGLAHGDYWCCSLSSIRKRSHSRYCCMAESWRMSRPC